MLSKLRTMIGTFLILGMIFGAYAADPNENVRVMLQKQFPNMQIDDIRQSPVPELIQVSAGPNIIYVTKDARYVIAGDIIDMQDKQNNITESFRKVSRAKNMQSKSDNAIVFEAPHSKYVVTAFTDVDCGYCRKLHFDVKKLNELGITIRYLAFPRGGPNTDTYTKMVKVWCAKDKKQAFDQAVHDKSLGNDVCTNSSIEKQFEQGLQMGVNGTPTLMFEDGTLVPGYLPPEKMLEVAKQLKK